jgi:hypothetical protein
VSLYDAVLVLGGGVRDNGVLPGWVISRLRKAVERRGDAFVIALSAGTPHRSPPLERGFPLFESVAEARYLVNAGVPRDKVLQETSSYDTIGNAYFARTIHTDPAGFSKLLVITSDFHIRRAEMIFRWVFNLTPSRLVYELEFEATTEPQLDPEVARERAAKESSSLDQIKPEMELIRDLKTFHRWFFAEHGAYKAGAECFGNTQLNSKLLELY